MSDILEVTLSNDLFVSNVSTIRVRQRQGLVYLFANDKALEMRTPAAHKAGFALVKQASEALSGEFVKFSINGVALNFPPKGAKQVGAALLRKADDADDFQKRINR